MWTGISRSNAISWVEIRVVQAIASTPAATTRPTGSRLSGNSSAITIIDPRTGVTITRSEYVGRLESRIRLRLDFITRTLNVEPVEPDASDRDFEALAAKVDDYLQIINDR